MRRSGWIWLAFGLCVALATLAMTRVGAVALELQRAEARTRRQAALDENLQLALWRMDSALAPLISEEGMRPYFTYTAFYPAERAYTHMFEALKKGEVLVASPLLTYASPRVRLHFQFGPDGRLNSPQVPEGTMRDLAESRFLPPGQLPAAAHRLDELRRMVSQPAMDVACATDSPSPAGTTTTGMIARFPNLPEKDEAAQTRGSTEYAMRSRNTMKAQAVTPERSLPLASSEPVSQGSMEATWIGEALILGRRVRVGQDTFLQGCWLDWDVIRAELLGSVIDLLPNASLEPVRTDDQAPTLRLAALPARLVVRPAADEVPTSWSPVTFSLWIAWACLVVTAAAVGLLLGGALLLSERRGTFVSAVTHELRTPLTTFRLYTEMLSEGMVRDPETRDSYLRTLRTESDRLGHLVENVLSFAHIERGRSIDRRDVVSAPDLVERVRPALAARAERGGMELVIGDEFPGVRLRTDVSVVEQILANLVDNASKYAGTAADRRIELDFAGRGYEARPDGSGPRPGRAGTGHAPPVPPILEIGPRRGPFRAGRGPGAGPQPAAGPSPGWRLAARAKRCRRGELRAHTADRWLTTGGDRPDRSMGYRVRAAMNDPLTRMLFFS